MAKGGIIIRKEISRIFHGIRQIIYEDEEQDWSQNCLCFWGTPALIGRRDKRILLKAACSLRWMEAICRKFEDQCRVPDCIKYLRYVQRDSPDLTSEIEGFNPLLGEQK